MKIPSVACLIVWCLTVCSLADTPSPNVAVLNAEKGFWEYTLPSEFLSKPARVQVLLPEKVDPQRQYPVLYVLPVDSSSKEPWGNGLAEARKADVANKYGVICVYPLIDSGIQWYGNHATEAGNRQEDFIIQTLIPSIDSKYPTRRNKEGRWLIGFSKSGWGAYTLLMRNKDVFGYAAAWDVPFMLNGDNSGKDWGPMGLSGNYGTKEAMKPNVPTRLAIENAGWLKQRNRLVLGVGSFWADQCKQMHKLLEKNEIPHVYRSDLLGKHEWKSGWFAPMTDDLVKVAQTP
jgi:enterochelin esterase-like enzyme